MLLIKHVMNNWYQIKFKRHYIIIIIFIRTRSTQNEQIINTKNRWNSATNIQNKRRVNN